MMFGLLRALARIRVTVAYAVILTGVSSVLVALGPRVQNRVISHASTNLHNLSHGHLGTLFVSAFVIEAGPIYVWLPGLMCLMALAELMWRSRRLVVAFAIGHIGATLLVAVGLTAAVELGWLSTDVTRATDVGMSYGASAVLGALSAAIPSRLRPAWIGWWIAIAVAVVAVNRDFTDVGHGMALVLGVLASTRFGHAARWTPTRCLLLLVASAFGFLMLANNTPTLIAASGLGVVGAALAQAVVWRRPARQPASGSAAERAPTLHVTPLSVPDHL
jgi:hypothetical protein